MRELTCAVGFQTLALLHRESFRQKCYVCSEHKGLDICWTTRLCCWKTSYLLWWCVCAHVCCGFAQGLLEGCGFGGWGIQTGKGELRWSMLTYIKDTLPGPLGEPDNGWVTPESKDWKQLGRVLLNDLSLRNNHNLVINVSYFLWPFKVKKFSLLTLSNVSLNFLEKLVKRAVFEENGL